MWQQRLYLYQIVDGGKEVLIGEVEDKHDEVTTLKSTAQGKHLTLVIRAKVSSDDEIYVMDNLKVSQH